MYRDLVRRSARKAGSPSTTLGPSGICRAPLWRRVAMLGLQVAGTGVMVGIVTLGLLWNTLFAGMPVMPSDDNLWNLNREAAVEFLDTKGRTIAVRGPRYGRAVSAAQLPPHVVNAFIAAEDGRFREHGGFDVQSIFRALFENFRAGHTVQGGSTITQQLVKNLLLNQDQTIRRKAQEARLAAILETTLSKNQILDLYLNRIYFGAGAYGLDAAAHTYFSKAPADLTLAQAAMLATLPKSPSRLSGQMGGAAPRARQLYVIGQMVRGGFITPSQAVAALAEVLEFAETPAQNQVDHAQDYALVLIHELLPNPPADLVVKLSIDLDLQRKAQQVIEKEVAALSPTLEGAAILIDSDGAIRAMVGGRDYLTSKFNRATQARRQPGSAFKVFVYAASLEAGLTPWTVRDDEPFALEAGLTPWTVRDDEPFEVGSWRPRNYQDEYLGPVTLTQALALSLNTVAARVGLEIGPKNVAALAHRFGVRSPLHNYPSIALGTDEVTLLEMTSGYGVLARNGLRMTPYIVEEVRNSKGDLLYSRPIVKAPRVYAQSYAETMTAMLSRVVVEGTGRGARVPGWEVAGKTGTSQDWRDAWFFGYTTRFVAGVWIGNDDDQPMANVTGGSAPARVFSKLMASALEGIPPEPLAGAGLLKPFPTEEATVAEASASPDSGGAAVATVEVRGSEAPTAPAAEH
jgi:penicillin-binding protein 1A